MKSIKLRRFRTKFYPATDEVEIIFNEDPGAVGLKLHRAHAGRFLMGLGDQLSKLGVQGQNSVENVMPIEKLGASIAEDGTPVLRIGTKNLPDLAFAISPNQLEEVAAWLGAARMALQGRKPQ